MPDDLVPLPAGSQITSYTVHGRFPDGEEISEPHDDEATAIDAARMHEQANALDVSVERRIERIIAPAESAETLYVETIYEQQEPN